MSQDQENEPEREIARQSMREAMDAQRELLLQEEARRGRAKKRQEQQERVQRRREDTEKRARRAHARRVKALSDAQERMAAHVRAASRSLSAALQEIGDVSVPRHTAEGREQRRIIGSIQAAMGALRRVGRGHFYEPEIDLGAEIDAL